MMKNHFNLKVLFASVGLVSVVVVVLVHSKHSLSGFFFQTHPEVQESNVTFSWRTKNDVQSTDASKGGQHMKASPVKASEPCPEPPPDLVGRLHVVLETDRTLTEVRREVGSLLQQGGRYKPPNCVSKQKVAIIIPFRNQDEEMTHLLYYLHPILMRQQVDYGVYVINQDGEGLFNRAKLMNIGHVEALKEYDYDCFVFSDVDLVPLNDQNLYRCFDSPRHLSVAVDKFKFVLPYEKFFGGVISLSKDQFLKVNGFSNTFWGWGGEDDDLYNRIMIRLKSISRPDSTIGRYKMIKPVEESNQHKPKNGNKPRETKTTLETDGLNSLKYTVKDIEKDRLFTFITVNFTAPSA
ncbi:beta-1,4-galactosyltransferase 1-like [Kryptolebias marmoratus]|uniref:Beta-1,4-galactosyltransferase n=1 Tax=Kryptolebias marmoratus TaxID=37003 RepID=A0A3Q3B4S9_KRYMA|nr:beta-1,4-galactosyltransferase 1-like [Kryptolebias marmoratus]